MRLFNFFESDASEEAREKNLTYKGFGNWADATGKTVAKTINNKLQFIDNGTNVTSDEQYADEFAIMAHGDQHYGPYLYKYHLDKVVDIGREFHGTPLQLIVCRLHDILEDTAVTKEQLGREFTPEVAHIVDLLSNLGKDPQSKKETFERIRTNPDAVFVKLVDRLANVREGAKNKRYKQEYPLFRAILYREGEYEPMWARS